MVKKTGAVLTARQLAAGAVSSWQAKVEELEHSVASVMTEEREERALRKAEMEAQKASKGMQETCTLRTLAPGLCLLLWLLLLLLACCCASASWALLLHASSGRGSPTSPPPPARLAPPWPATAAHALTPLKRRNPAPYTLQASNMLEHEDEIFARPARTWFQTPKEKKEASAAGAPGKHFRPRLLARLLLATRCLPRPSRQEGRRLLTADNDLAPRSAQIADTARLGCSGLRVIAQALVLPAPAPSRRR